MSVTFINFFLFLKLIIHVHTHQDHDHGISDAEHYQQGSEHNTDYDHDAFLGKGHGHDFDRYEPEEAKKRLRLMIGKVDTNQDGLVDFDELHIWIDHQRTAFMWDNIDMVISRDDEDKDTQISWLEYKHSHYGNWDDDSVLDKKLREKIEKAGKKFILADVNKNGRLDRDEYVYFRHPEESRDELMNEIAIDEVIEEMDKDDNQIIDLEEFLGQYEDDDGEAPDWVVEDRKHFKESLDHDKSGVLERKEMKEWILPRRQDTIDEANHLITAADDNEDKKLNMEEIIDHHELFVGSTATDHGRALRSEL